MTERPMPPIPQGLDPEIAEKISGGALDMCEPDQIDAIVRGLRQNYDQLVDFTSYVFDRIAGN